MSVSVRWTFLHPLIADFGQQVDVEFISKQQQLLWAEMLKNSANARQFLDALRVIIFGNEFGAFPDPAEFVQVTAHGLCRDLHATIDLELGGQTRTTPARATSAEGVRSRLEQGSSERFKDGDKIVVRMGGCRAASAVKSKPSEWLR